ncbi:MAG: alpha/beta fold hydrolase [Thermoplasmatota archaeon]|nr:alpha/beta fold hydrolase [Halobacteriales archaeon]
MPERVRRQRRPVLLVHGILGTRHLYWNLFRHRLESDGFTVHEVALPFVLLGDIRSAARVLATAVQKHRASAGGGRVDIVAHSAGGLVARYYVQNLGGHRAVSNLVLLGTPHHGTIASYLLPVVKVAVQATPGSRLLGELNRKRPPARVRITNFWSPLDGIVIPAENSVLRAPGVRNVQLPRMHHWGFLVSNAVCDQVKRVLRSPRPRRRRAP